ncbi:MAG TPA: trypsin-like peptidase domain-containing protein [Pyrinomonadaceae bacterium]|nr:trypsin-like peptidase domain-containing protein [Pyrinomonadaceae bacterium]
MSKSFQTAVALVVFTCATHFVCAQQLRDSFRRVKASVVVVHINDTNPATSNRPGQVADSGLGSGVLISSDGKILTAAHVVEGEDRLLVEFANNEWIPARVISASAVADVALLQCDRVPKGVIAAKLGDSDKADTGDDIFIVGSPYGLSYTLTVGRISARRPDQSRSGLMSSVEFLQTDAAVNPGSSGSPVFNKDEEVIGIVSSIVSETGDFQGVGFAATVNSARAQLLDTNGKSTVVEGLLVVGALARALNVPQQAGFLVTTVGKGSLAERLTLKGGELAAVIDNQEVLLGGDIILEIDGTIVDGNRETYRSILARITNSESHALVRCKVLRNGRVIELSSK